MKTQTPEKVTKFNLESYGEANFGKALAFGILYYLDNTPLAELVVRLSEIDKLNFGIDGWSDIDVLRGLLTDRGVAILLHDEEENVIGYTVAQSAQSVYRGNSHYRGRQCDSTVAYIANTIIHPEFQGRGLVGLMMTKLEEALKQMGYVYVDRDSAVDNGYAQKVENHYGDKILIKNGPTDTIYGKQMYFRVKL